LFDGADEGGYLIDLNRTSDQAAIFALSVSRSCPCAD
jgi:hypothetical protein